MSVESRIQTPEPSPAIEADKPATQHKYDQKFKSYSDAREYTKQFFDTIEDIDKTVGFMVATEVAQAAFIHMTVMELDYMTQQRDLYSNGSGRNQSDVQSLKNAWKLYEHANNEFNTAKNTLHEIIRKSIYSKKTGQQ